jgi:predicted 3-demethylubiquinone-9 3-methyltransferase (glyoxalase superfamily)
MRIQTKVTPWLGFASQAEEAAKLYTSIIPDSRIVKVIRNPGDGSVLVVEFELGGLPVFSVNSGQEWKFSESFSFSVACDTQAELDRIWTALSTGGREVQCGWLVDRFGVSWQVVPSQIGAWLSDPDTEKSGRMFGAVMGMVKLDIAALKAAYEGKATTQ